MLKKISLLALLALFLLPLIPTTAQEQTGCSSNGLATRVDISYENFALASQDGGNFEDSLDSLDALYRELDDIYAECDEARYQDYVEEGTALLTDLNEGGYIL